jgi:hypothetical protein
MNHIEDTLRAARKLLENPRRWTKNEFARNAQNQGVGSMSEDAVCFCMTIAATAGPPGSSSTASANRPLARSTTKHRTPRF